MRRFGSKLANLILPGKAERELGREVTAHLILLQDEFERQGMPPEEAALAARRAYGGIEQAKELHRQERSFLWFEQLLQDLRHSGRSLKKSPGFTLLAVIALSLGIGVNTTLFTTYNAVALKPLPVSDPDHVVRFERWVKSAGVGSFQYGFSYPEYVYCRDHANEFSGLVAASWVLTLPASATAPVQKLGQLVSANYFDALGIHPLLGRGFLADEDQTPGADRVVVLGYRFWKRERNGDSQVLGKTIKLNDASFTIIGVAPEEFTGTPETPAVMDFWVPLSAQAQLVPGQRWLDAPDEKRFQIFARLTSPRTLPAAQAHVDSLIRQFATTYIEQDPTTSVTLPHTSYFPNTDDTRFRALVAALTLILGMVLLVACANVGNMQLSRGSARRREIATRLALGATRGRLIRQLLTESILLSCLGGLAGLLLSVWTTRLLGVALQQYSMVLQGDFSALNLAPDLRVMAYALAISVSAGIFFGLSPALQSTRRDMTESLKEETGSAGHLGGSRLRSLLVGVQVTLSILLLATAGLLARGLVRSKDADPGFETRDVFALAADFGDFGSDPVKTAARKKLLVDRLNAEPELARATVGNIPFGGTWTPPMIAGSIRGRTLASYASDNYLDTLGIPLVRGRRFTVQEANGGGPIAIISESAARQFFPGADPLGKTFVLDMNFRGNLRGFEVVGIAKDIRFANLTRVDPAHVYLPAGSSGSAGFLSILVRVRGNHRQALAAVEAAVNRFDATLAPSLRLINLDESSIQIQRQISRFFVSLAAVLAVLSVTLAGVGIYGVIAYLVSRRTREIGIRLALGGGASAVWKGVILQGLRPVFAGAVVGIAAAAGLSALLHQTLLFPGSMDVLYGVPFYDPMTFSALLVFVLGIAALASFVPARRAMRVDPAVALRYE